ncbi:MAG: DUF6339 family protein [bacterium]|nr:DUF6339 family protein [bacterium]
MNKAQYQKIFKRAAVAQMRADLRSEKSLKGYFEKDYPVKNEDLLPSTVEIQGKPPILEIPKKDPVSADLDNAIALYGYYRKLDELQASDPRLWAYLSHVEFRKYSLARWGFGETAKGLKKEDEPKAINYFLEHWFISGNDRDLRRHAIARLWWAAHLTYAPWERDPEFFGDMKEKDPYCFTRTLFFTQDIYQQVLERAMGRSDRILISVLEYLRENKKFADVRENVRDLMKELNLAYGTKKIITLDRASLKSLIERVAKEISTT